MDLLDDDLDISALESNVLTVRPSNNQPQKATHHKVDEDTAKTYIYPKNLPRRDYQYNIVARALFHNVLVALPTGLGKTFIASTVMLNYLRWFPESKIIFMAPTKPLVAQQIKACCSITGIPSSQSAILLDKTRKNRADIWASKQVFFTTPQVVENDLATGIVHPKSVALLVIDEAHRAKGNYAYNNVVKFLNRFTKSYRILALTATPAADVDGVQEIVNNLHISKVEVRTEKSIDIFRYLKRKTIDRITVGQSDEIKICVDLICEAIKPVLETANQRNIYEIKDPRQINAFSALTSQQQIIKNPSIPEGLKWSNYFILQLLVVVGQCHRRLNIYGLRSFYHYFSEKHKEFTTKYDNKKSTNHLAAKFYYHDSINRLLRLCEEKIADPDYIAHPKLDAVLSELTHFFDHVASSNSRVIIFTEFRESALDIVSAIERSSPAFKPHIFIGQAREKDKFDEEKFLSKGRKKKKQTEEPPQKKAKKQAQSSSEEAQMNGMNQKMQKELIKKFKQGEYNVLVATSIGEEGLDIGEVDLIICYDSTSSPIKNIQRMGRTGRSRDGKVLLLFASNEESKFDKAMGGYEYIQQHIMNENLIQLHEQNRMLPKQFTPTVEERIIDIPDENVELKNEDDDDEIIRIATRHMTKTAGKKAAKGKQKKIEKQFFMPDDVETGFMSVSAMLKSQNGKPKPKEDEKSDKSDDEDDPLMHLDSLLSSDRSFAGQKSEKDLSQVTQNSLHSKQRTIDSVFERQTEEKSIPQPASVKKVEKRQPPKKAPVSVKKEPKVEDDFDDDDDEILELARKSGSFGSLLGPAENESKLELYKNEFSEQDGVLNEEQNAELYMAYFVPANSSDLVGCYDPHVKDYKDFKTVPHSITSENLSRALDFTKNDNKRSTDIIQHYRELAKEKSSPLKDFIDFE